MTLVYLAGGMEYTSNGYTWREKATELLSKNNIHTWDPCLEESKVFNNKNIDSIKKYDKIKNYKKLNNMMKKLVVYDLNIIHDSASHLLVKYDESVKKGAGTHGEISFARYFNIPVHAWLADLNLNEVPGWAIGCFHSLSYTLEEAVDKVLKDVKEYAKDSCSVEK